MYRITCKHQMTEAFTHWSTAAEDKETVINIDDSGNVSISSTRKTIANRLFKAGNTVWYDTDESGLPCYCECVNPTHISWSMIR